MKNSASKKIKVAVDARMVNMSGIGTYLQNLLKNDCYDIALGNEEDITKHKNIKVIEYDSKIYGIKEQLKFPYKKLRKEHVDVLHVPHYNIPLFYRGKMIVTVHDLTHLVYPQFLPNKFAYFYAKFMIGRALKKSYKVLTISESTKKDILKFYRVDPKKIIIIPNGVSDEFTKKAKKEYDYLYKKYNISKDKKILMYVGNLKEHKNLGKLLEAFSLLQDKEEYMLILVGKAFSNIDSLTLKEKELKIEKNIIHTGIVSQEELVDFYNLADLFVFPSLYEGFGLPVIESLKCGTPVIASNVSSIPEVGGDIIGYFNPCDANDIKESIEKHINDQLDYKKALNWCNNFDWKKTAEQIKEQFK